MTEKAVPFCVPITRILLLLSPCRYSYITIFFVIPASDVSIVLNSELQEKYISYESCISSMDMLHTFNMIDMHHPYDLYARPLIVVTKT